MKILKPNAIVVIMLMLLLMGSGTSLWAAGPSPVYEHVMDALSQLPRNRGITVDFGVKDEHYTEQFTLTEATLRLLREAQASEATTKQLSTLKNEKFSSKEAFMAAVEQAIGKEQAMRHESVILNSAYDGNAIFAIGDPFEARFRADTDCYIALIHIGVDSKDSVGDIVVLLPNQRMTDARIKAGQVYSTVRDFSIQLTASLPPGYEMLNVLCSTEPFDLFQNTGAFYAGYAVISPTDEAALQYLLHGLQQQAASERFGGTSLELRIGSATRALPKKFGMLKPMGGTGTTGKFFPPLNTP